MAASRCPPDVSAPHRQSRDLTQPLPLPLTRPDSHRKSYCLRCQFVSDDDDDGLKIARGYCLVLSGLYTPDLLARAVTTTARSRGQRHRKRKSSRLVTGMTGSRFSRLVIRPMSRARGSTAVYIAPVTSRFRIPQT